MDVYIQLRFFISFSNGSVVFGKINICFVNASNSIWPFLSFSLTLCRVDVQNSSFRACFLLSSRIASIPGNVARNIINDEITARAFFFESLDSLYPSDLYVLIKNKFDSIVRHVSTAVSYAMPILCYECNAAHTHTVSHKR